MRTILGALVLAVALAGCGTDDATGGPGGTCAGGRCDSFLADPACPGVDASCSDLGPCSTGWFFDSANCECACNAEVPECPGVDASCSDLGSCPSGWVFDRVNCECACNSGGDPWQGIADQIEQGSAPVVDAELGVWAIYAPGAMTGVIHHATLADLYAATPGAEQAMGFGSCLLQTEAAVDFDCDAEFSAPGCFLEGVGEGSTPITGIMDDLEEYEIVTFSAEERAAAQRTEAEIVYAVVVTETYLRLYYGIIDGQAVLLAVDLATYSCDA